MRTHHDSPCEKVYQVPSRSHKQAKHDFSSKDEGLTYLLSPSSELAPLPKLLPCQTSTPASLSWFAGVYVGLITTLAIVSPRPPIHVLFRYVTTFPIS